jgi:hypothetical protein
MKKILAGLLLAFLFTNPAHAKYSFGKQDNLHEIQQIKLKGPKGESLYLGYRTTAMNFFAGVYLKDQGYILGVRDVAEETYYQLDPKLIKELQSDGSLPKPLPKYEISSFDYFIGYLLWIVLFSAAAFYSIKALIFKAISRRNAASAG